MSEKVVGVLGGMGPEATAAFYSRLIANTPAARDQDHLRVLIDSNAKTPDRTAALLGGGESPVAQMAAGAAALQRAGADFIVMPCVTAHAFFAEVAERIGIPFVSMLDTAAEEIRAARPAMARLGLLATSGTVEAGLFQDRLAREGVEVLVPEGAAQDRVLAAIRAVKSSAAAASAARAAITASLVEVAAGLVARGAQGIILGCTELPLVLSQQDLDVPVFDPSDILARAAIRFAGREPVGR
jgi:aspartate racemase